MTTNVPESEEPFNPPTEPSASLDKSRSPTPSPPSSPEKDLREESSTTTGNTSSTIITTSASKSTVEEKPQPPTNRSSPSPPSSPTQQVKVSGDEKQSSESSPSPADSTTSPPSSSSTPSSSPREDKKPSHDSSPPSPAQPPTVPKLKISQPSVVDLTANNTSSTESSTTGEEVGDDVSEQEAQAPERGTSSSSPPKVPSLPLAKPPSGSSSSRSSSSKSSSSSQSSSSSTSSSESSGEAVRQSRPGGDDLIATAPATTTTTTTTMTSPGDDVSTSSSPPSASAIPPTSPDAMIAGQPARSTATASPNPFDDFDSELPKTFASGETPPSVSPPPVLGTGSHMTPESFSSDPDANPEVSSAPPPPGMMTIRNLDTGELIQLGGEAQNDVDSLYEDLWVFRSDLSPNSANASESNSTVTTPREMGGRRGSAITSDEEPGKSTGKKIKASFARMKSLLRKPSSHSRSNSVSSDPGTSAGITASATTASTAPGSATLPSRPLDGANTPGSPRRPVNNPNFPRVHASKKNHREFYAMERIQSIKSEHTGAVFVLKWSLDGRYLASAGADGVVRVWQVTESLRTALANQPKPPQAPTTRRGSWTGSTGSRGPSTSEPVSTSDDDTHSAGSASSGRPELKAVLDSEPLMKFVGHTKNVLDLSWSHNHFLLSASMDKTVRLWHVSRPQCLCLFQHWELVSSVAFHPLDDHLFASGSMDNKVRVWNILEKKVQQHMNTGDLVTALTYSPDAKYVITGSYNGVCTFYFSDTLKYFTQVHVRSRRGKNAKGHKISGLEVSPSKEQLLVTSNDSRIRLYNLADYSLVCKFKGNPNDSSQIRASFDASGQYIVCGSDTKESYIWNTVNPYIPPINPMFTGFRRDRNESYERFQSSESMVTCSLFAPFRSPYIEPAALLTASPSSFGRRHSTHTPVGTPRGGGGSNFLDTAETSSVGARSADGFQEEADEEHPPNPAYGMIMVSADYSGAIQVYVNHTRLKRPV